MLTDAKKKRILRLKAENPIESWAAIAEAVNESKSAVQSFYRRWKKTLPKVQEPPGTDDGPART